MRGQGQDRGARGQRLALLLLPALLAGCAQRGPVLPPVSGTPPARATANQVEMLIAGSDALAARLDIIERARERVVFQYYLIHADSAGELFAAALLRAADRGVKVRGLIDDISGADKRLMTALAAHPNIRIRRYNPFRLQELRLPEIIFNSRKAGRRMHNKHLTVDGRYSIVGGRNIGDEYFGSSEDIAFADLDVLVAGPAAAEVERSFQEYWSAPLSKERRSGRPERLQALRERLAPPAAGARAALQALVRGSVFQRRAAEGRLLTQACPTLVLVDHPAKPPDRATPESRVAWQLAARLRAAKKDVFLVSAYFVPGEVGAGQLAEAVQRGVRVEVVTNSLASLDVPAVHVGYKRYREPLLQAGVTLWETRPLTQAKSVPQASLGAAGAGLAGSSRASLHTKAYFFDHRHVFVGSFNLDPRSAMLNTEMGLLFDCPELAQPLRATLGRALPALAWRVALTPEGELRWEGLREGETGVSEREPGASLWRRLLVWSLGWLPIESEL
jgi:putative cardiolipin synthase